MDRPSYGCKFTILAWALMATASGVATAQTIDELAQAQKKLQLITTRVVPTSQTGGQTAAAPAAAPSAPAAEAKAEPKASPKRHQISVVSISGRTPADLSAQIYEPGWRILRVKKGDQTASGWTVQAISPQAVTFSKFVEVSGGKSTKGAAKSGHGSESEEVRVTVLWGDSSAAENAVSMATLARTQARPAGMAVPVIPAPNLPVPVTVQR